MKSFESQPLISCLYIAEDEPRNIFRVVFSFLQQDYMAKELVVVCSDKDEVSKNFLKLIVENEEVNIKFLFKETFFEAQSLLNQVIEILGEFVCIWDGNYLYSNDRITRQFNFLKQERGYEAGNILTQIILYHTFEPAAYFSLPALWIKTIMCTKECLKNVYAINTSYIEVLEQVVNTCHLQKLFGCSNLAIIIYDRQNTIPYHQFLAWINCGELLPIEFTNDLRKYIHDNLQVFKV
jgi:hypothetical protein